MRAAICAWCERHGDFPSLCFPKKCGLCGESRCSRHRLRLSHGFSRRIVYICHDRHLGKTIAEVLTSAKKEAPVR